MVASKIWPPILKSTCPTPIRKAVRALPLRINFETSTIPVSLGETPDDDSFFFVSMGATSNTEKGIEFFRKLEAAVNADAELASTIPAHPSYPFEGLTSPEVLRKIEISVWGDEGLTEEGYIYFSLQGSEPFHKGRVKGLRVTHSPA